MAISVHKQSNLLILLLLVVGCVYQYNFKPEDVKEYRYFPEYRGYFPIRDTIVHADWVLPVITPDGKYDYTLPSSPEEAKYLVKQAAEKNKKFVNLSPVVTELFGTALILSPFLLHSNIYVNMNGAHRAVHPEKLQQKPKPKPLEQLEEFAGIKIKILVIDKNGVVIPNARIIELVTPTEVLDFVNKDGVRSFAPPVARSYTLYNKKMLELIVKHLPIYIGGEDTTFDQIGDQTGKVIYTSLVPGRFARYLEKKERWVWERPLTPLTLSFVVWAPGFKPSIYSVPEVKVRDEVNLTATLEMFPDRERIEKIYSELENIFGRISFKIEKTDTEAVKEELRKWIKDESLPSYIRWNAWNAYKLLEEISKSEGKITPESKKIKIESLTPYLSDSPSNPWRLKERYEKLFSPLFYPSGGHRKFETTSVMVDEARDLLSKVSAINPDIPELDTLRAIIVLSEGDREHAIQLSRYMNHSHFFNLFYGLSTSEPSD